MHDDIIMSSYIMNIIVMIIKLQWNCCSQYISIERHNNYDCPSSSDIHCLWYHLRHLTHSIYHTFGIIINCPAGSYNITEK